MRDADTAMYTAKTQGKALHQMFDKGMHAQAMARLQLENDLRRAAERQEFRLHYQPIVSLKTDRIIGFEDLVRWQHPNRGIVSPADFLPVAKRTGLIISIDRWVLREACRQMRAWQARFPAKPPLFISVSLSRKQFVQPDLIEQIRHVLQETVLEPRSLRPEITESEIMEDFESAISILSQLKDLNILLHMDDFGTGYSSLSYLIRFRVNTLKIDRSFVSNMDASGENFVIIQMIITLARNLGINVIAEGVEMLEQQAQLKELKCEYAQGYLFSKPLDSEEVEALLETNPRW